MGIRLWLIMGLDLVVRRRLFCFEKEMVVSSVMREAGQGLRSSGGMADLTYACISRDRFLAFLLLRVTVRTPPIFSCLYTCCRAASYSTHCPSSIYLTSLHKFNLLAPKPNPQPPRPLPLLHFPLPNPPLLPHESVTPRHLPQRIPLPSLPTPPHWPNVSNPHL